MGFCCIDGLCVGRLENTWVFKWDLMNYVFVGYKHMGFCCFDELCVGRMENTWVFKWDLLL